MINCTGRHNCFHNFNVHSCWHLRAVFAREGDLLNSLVVFFFFPHYDSEDKSGLVHTPVNSPL